MLGYQLEQLWMLTEALESDSKLCYLTFPEAISDSRGGGCAPTAGQARPAGT